jgi:hypothetical protein
MTVDEYYAVIRRLGLRPTKVRTVYVTASGEAHRVPDATAYAPEQRAEIIATLKVLMGIEREE